MGDTVVPGISLEHELLRLVEQGIVISADVLFYAESTCGLRSNEIESALRDPQLEERDELLALILTPDMQMRTALEPLLPASPACSSGELETLMHSLNRKIKAFHLLIPGVTRFSLPVEKDDIDYFVGKFYFDRALDTKLVETLERFFPSETVIACRLVLRCRGYMYTEKEKDFLCRFIEKSRAHVNQIIDLFTLMVTLLAQMQEHETIDDYLLGRRRHLIKKLKEIKEFEQKREQYSMEYLMMQRYPIPHESEEQVIAQLHMVTTITDLILGLPPDPSFQAELRNLGTYGRRTDISDIIRMLS
ncbi:MAG: hypothetical protein KJO28_02800 [Desulfofustis sp.]|nr:hypothetical protein [Desulfofustis sp.]